MTACFVAFHSTALSLRSPLRARRSSPAISALLSRYNHERLTPGLGDGKIACTLSDQRRALAIEAAFVASARAQSRRCWPIYRPGGRIPRTGLKR